MTTSSTDRRHESRPTQHAADAEPSEGSAGLSPSTLLRQAGAGLRLLLVITVLFGVIYPLGVWAVARIPGLASHAEGSLIEGPAGPTGSSLIGIDPVPANPGADPWFHTRPSASAPNSSPAGLGPADPTTSGGSNLAADSTTLADAVTQRRGVIAGREGVSPELVPPDAVTASGSGLDPQISPAYAALQAPRVARVTRLSLTQVQQLIVANTQGRGLGFAGEPGVNVPAIDAALRAASPSAR